MGLITEPDQSLVPVIKQKMTDERDLCPIAYVFLVVFFKDTEIEIFERKIINIINQTNFPDSEKCFLKIF